MTSPATHAARARTLVISERAEVTSHVALVAVVVCLVGLIASAGGTTFITPDSGSEVPAGVPRDTAAWGAGLLLSAVTAAAAAVVQLVVEALRDLTAPDAKR